MSVTREYCPSCSDSWIPAGCSEQLLGAGVPWDVFPPSKSSLPLSFTSGFVTSWATHHVNPAGKTSCFPSHAPLQVESDLECLWLIWECLQQHLSKQCLRSAAVPRQWEQSLDAESVAEDSGQHHAHPVCPAPSQAPSPPQPSVKLWSGKAMNWCSEYPGNHLSRVNWGECHTLIIHCAIFLCGIRIMTVTDENFN